LVPTNARRKAEAWQDKNLPIVESMVAYLDAGETVRGAADAVELDGLCSDGWAIKKWKEAGHKYPLLYGRAERAAIRIFAAKLREEVELAWRVLSAFARKLR
jgi:hypothetical protein